MISDIEELKAYFLKNSEITWFGYNKKEENL